MAETIRVNTSSLTNTKNNVNNQVININAQITELYQDVSLLNSMWEGEAHDAFHTAFTADLRRVQELNKSLLEIVSYEDNAIKEYDKCEKQVSSLIAGIKI